MLHGFKKQEENTMVKELDGKYIEVIGWVEDVYDIVKMFEQRGAILVYFGKRTWLGTINHEGIAIGRAGSPYKQCMIAIQITKELYKEVEMDLVDFEFPDPYFLE